MASATGAVEPAVAHPKARRRGVRVALAVVAVVAAFLLSACLPPPPPAETTYNLVGDGTWSEATLTFDITQSGYLTLYLASPSSTTCRDLGFNGVNGGPVIRGGQITVTPYTLAQVYAGEKFIVEFRSYPDDYGCSFTGHFQIDQTPIVGTGV